MQFDDWLASASTHRKTDRLLSARDLGTAFVTSSPLICGCACSPSSNSLTVQLRHMALLPCIGLA